MKFGVISLLEPLLSSSTCMLVWNLHRIKMLVLASQVCNQFTQSLQTTNDQVEDNHPFIHNQVEVKLQENQRNTLVCHVAMQHEKLDVEHLPKNSII